MNRDILRAALAAAVLVALLLTGPRPAAAGQPTPAAPVEGDYVDQAEPAPYPAAGETTVVPSAGANPVQTGPPLPLFYNYYVGPPGVPAQLYPMPRPTPAFVGQVWITYPPLMPHEFLYHHHRRYYKYTPGGYSSASVHYSSGLAGWIYRF